MTERNWLLVFTYTTWGGNANLPHFVEGMQFAPTEVRGGQERPEGLSIGPRTKHATKSCWLHTSTSATALCWCAAGVAA